MMKSRDLIKSLEQFRRHRIDQAHLGSALEQCQIGFRGFRMIQEAPAGITQHQPGGQDHLPRGDRNIRVDPSEQKLRGSKTHLISGLDHHRQEGKERRQARQVVESHQGHIAGHPEATAPQPFHNPGSQDVIGSHDSRGVEAVIETTSLYHFQ